MDNNKLWQVCQDCGQLWCTALAAAHGCALQQERREREAKQSARAAAAFVGPHPEGPNARLRRKLRALRDNSPTKKD